jgi:SM-20-related protein
MTNAEEIAETLAAQGWCATPDFAAPALVEALAAEARALAAQGALREGRVGYGEGKKLDQTQRRDRIAWLDEAALTPPQRAWMDSLEDLRQAINQRTMAGLFSWEGHLALYPPGGFYKRHLDVLRRDHPRQVSSILYLNPDWAPEDGGQLRIYLDGDALEPFVDVAPRAGTLALFWSSDTWHEVLPAHRDRLSLTGWFRRRA